MNPFDKIKRELGFTGSSVRTGSCYTLKHYLDERRISYTTGLNILQAHGVISDNVEDVLEVYPSDQLKAVEWLRVNVWRDKFNKLKISSET